MFYDLFGAVASLLCTYYYIRVNTKAWSIGLIASAVNCFLYWQNGIYADMSLESFYFISMCYGWYCWSEPKNNEESIILSLKGKQWWYLLGAGVVFYGIIYLLLTTFSHSTIAELDALTTALSLIAQWLMCRKIITTWVVWFITDSLYTLMYFHKHLPFHGVLMIIYTVMAVIGYLSWAKQQRFYSPIMSKL